MGINIRKMPYTLSRLYFLSRQYYSIEPLDGFGSEQEMIKE